MNVRFVLPSAKDSPVSHERKLPLVVGRSAEAKIRFSHETVSRKHCEIFEKDGGVFVRDLGSSNGTFVDGEPIPTLVPIPIPPGSTIRVAGFPMRIEYEPITSSGDDDETASVRVQRPAPAKPAGKAAAKPSADRTPAPPAAADAMKPLATVPGGPVPGGPVPGVAVPDGPGKGQPAADAFVPPADDLPSAAPAELEVTEPEPLEITAEVAQGETGFSFLDAAAAEAAPDDEHLGDFFKSLE